MSDWKFIDFIYLYDGTFEGLLTIVFDCFTQHTFPKAIVPFIEYSFNFLEKTFTVKTETQKAQRIFQGILKNISYDTLYNAYYAFLSSEKGKELVIVQYLCLGFQVGDKVNHMLATSYVFKVLALKKRTFGEAHRLKGLVRFQEVGENLFYSSIHPDNNVLEILGHHFCKRLANQNFVIHDKNRDIAFFYDTKHYEIIEAKDLHIPSITLAEKEYQLLWKTFFQTISIKERTNPRCQMQFMPKKYWKDLVELLP